MKALLVGRGTELMFALPYLLKRSGFTVIDVVAENELISHSKFINNFTKTQAEWLSNEDICKIDVYNYDLIVVCNDDTLKAVLNSDLSEEKKLKFLPIFAVKDFKHIYSKIGLSKVLQDAGINTPKFEIACGLSEILKSAYEIQYPLMIKLDVSGGGVDVFECGDEFEIRNLPNYVFENPVLIQKKIIGKELDLSALYFEKKLIHFAHATPEKTIGKFGPSSLRTYTQIASVDQQIFLDLINLGEALGADGFVNISAIKSSQDGKLYFFECDMRPTVWADYSRFFGDDLAPKIKNWFLSKETMKFPDKTNEKYSSQIRLSYFYRLSRYDICFNRYNVWKYLPKEDNELLKILLLEKIIPKKEIGKLLRKIKRFPTDLIRYFLPKKEDRVILRQKIKRFLFLDKVNQQS